MEESNTQQGEVHQEEDETLEELSCELESSEVLVETHSETHGERNEAAEKALEEAIHEMELMLSQKGTPDFKRFWEFRKKCTELFKERITPSLRVLLWEKYSELCQQARQLKDIFDQQSAFAAEQIDVAIAAIEKEVSELPQLIEKVEHVEIHRSIAIEEHFDTYIALHKELLLLNMYAARTHALRKELMKQDMRYRYKNKFFHRLSAIGDKIFPRRKDLIKEMSDLFVQDVEAFIQKTFREELKTKELFSIRDEIKILQSIAKELTLNTEAFSKTRQRLSECWDSIKHVVKERKKAFNEQSLEYEEHKKALLEEVAHIQERYKNESLSPGDCKGALATLSSKAKKTSLTKQQLREVFDQVRIVEALIDEKLITHERASTKKKEEKEKIRKNKTYALLARYDQAVEDIETYSLDLLKQEFATLEEELAQCELIANENRNFYKRRSFLQDTLAFRIEQEQVEKAGKDQEALLEVLNARLARKQAIRKQLDTWKKEQAAAGLNLGEAMECESLIHYEKERLATIEKELESLQDHIEE